MQTLQIVVPMAGLGSRFSRTGYGMPKPLIDVGGRHMIDVVIQNLRPTRPHRFVFVVQRAHVLAHGLADRLSDWAPGCGVVAIDGVTAGAACTVLEAKGELEPGEPLMIANCDQWVDTDIDDYLEHHEDLGLDGFLMTMWGDDPKWSYAEVDQLGRVRRIAEKQVISDVATVGIYNWRRAGDFLAHADRMIAADCRVNGEFYVAPVYNWAIEAGAQVGVVDVPGMHGLGTPEDLASFLAGPLLGRAVAGRDQQAAAPGRGGRPLRHVS